MAFWIFLWKATFIIGLILFALLSAYVTIFGARDAKLLLDTLKQEQGNGEG